MTPSKKVAAALRGRSMVEIIRREHDWLFYLSGDASIGVGCLWRIISQRAIAVTGTDDGNRFGPPDAVDAEARGNALVAERAVRAVEVMEGSGDLRLHFDNHVTLEFVSDSSGFEAWALDLNPELTVSSAGGVIRVTVERGRIQRG